MPKELWVFRIRMQHTGASLVIQGLRLRLPLQGCVMAMRHVRSELLYQGSNPHPLHWKNQVLTTGLPGKSLSCPEESQKSDSLPSLLFPLFNVVPADYVSDGIIPSLFWVSAETAH